MPDRARVEAWLNRAWYGGAGAAWLRPPAGLFGALVVLRAALYRTGLLRRHRAGAPVIVVGNLTVGGSGKTPLVLWLARRLAAAGHRPGIATRGHGRGGTQVQLVATDSTPDAVGDEPLLLARRAGVPVCVGRDRVAAARRLVAAGCDVVLCDDGLQHLRLARDLEIAVVDGARGLGNGCLLPAGPLRERAGRLRGVDLVVVNGTLRAPLPPLPRPPLSMQLEGDVALALAGTAPPRPLAAFAGSPVHAVAGIGNPGRFFDALRARGLTVIEHAFPDHHAYEAADLRFGDALPVLMTEKDAVKCGSFRDVPGWYVPVDAAFGAADESRLLARLAGVTTPSGVALA